MEDWLYEDGEDETKGVYVAKLEELKKVSIIIIAYVFFFFNLYWAIYDDGNCDL